MEEPIFVEKAAPTHTVDGKRGLTEYAGAVALPFTTDDSHGATIQGSGQVFVHRVHSARGTDDLFVFLEDIPVRVHDTSTPIKGPATVEIYIDNNRFTGGASKLPAAEDRRYTIDLNGTMSGSPAVKVDAGNGATWIPSTASTTFVPGGCKLVKSTIATCSGELRLTLDPSAMQPPSSFLLPGIGFQVRGVNETGTAPELPVTKYTALITDTGQWQTILFGKPRGFNLSVMTWNVRRFGTGIFGDPDSDWLSASEADIGTFLAKHDIVAIQEGWDSSLVQKILNAANQARSAAKLPLFHLSEAMNFKDASLTQSLGGTIEGETQGGVWIMTWLPFVDGAAHSFSSDYCRGEDCLKAKGVVWKRIALQDPESYDPVCLKDHPATGCGQVPSGDDFIDVFATHTQSPGPEFCDAGTYVEVLTAGTAIALTLQTLFPWLPYGPAISVMQGLLATGMNCWTIDDQTVHVKQLIEMNNFITAHAAMDRPSLVMGDFNINGKTTTNNSEYMTLLSELGLASPSNPLDDRISIMPNGPDIQHGDVIRQPSTGIDVTSTLTNGRCGGTFIDKTSGIADTTCASIDSQMVDGLSRYDYMLVRPPELPEHQGNPRWIIEEQDNQRVWASPSPTLAPIFTAGTPPPQRLSDHKPVVSSFEIARLENPPLYHPTWRHTTEQRITHLDASGVADCGGCGPVDPASELQITLEPQNTPNFVFGSECTDIAAPSFPEDFCIADWFKLTDHDPATTSSVNMWALVWDDDDTSGNDTLSHGTRDSFNYKTGTWIFRHNNPDGTESTERTWPMTEEAPMAACGGLDVSVCHQITVTPVPLGQ